VKAIRAGRAQLKEAYVVLMKGETFVIGMHVSALPTASTHVTPDPTRKRKLLLNAPEIAKLIGKVEQKGYTLVPINLHYAKGRVKMDIGLAKGKKQHDKRDAERERPALVLLSPRSLAEPRFMRPVSRLKPKPLCRRVYLDDSTGDVSVLAVPGEGHSDFGASR
jgi:SsrA-binding protein